MALGHSRPLMPPIVPAREGVIAPLLSDPRPAFWCVEVEPLAVVAASMINMPAPTN